MTTNADSGRLTWLVPSDIISGSDYAIQFFNYEETGTISSSFIINNPSFPDLSNITNKTCSPSNSCSQQKCVGSSRNCTITNTDCSTISTVEMCNQKPSTSCDSVVKSIVDSIGGCLNIDKTQYSNIYNLCCLKITKESLLSLLNNALADGKIDANEKISLLTALNSYLK